MFARSLLVAALAAGSAEAFIAPSPMMGLQRLSLRSGACSSLKMVDWSEPVEKYDGAGADRGQVNKAADIKAQMDKRLEEARMQAQTKNVGWHSEYGANLKEGDRDPQSGRLVIDPLKIPTSDQGAPASFAEYMERRAKQSGGKVEAYGKDVTDVRPSAPVMEGSWGAPPQRGDHKEDWLTGKPVQDVKIGGLTPEQEEWNRKRREEEAKQKLETEARMAKWMAEAKNKENK